MLERLISRTLIEQQIQQEYQQTTQPSADEIAARLHEIRTEAPAGMCSSRLQIG